MASLIIKSNPAQGTAVPIPDLGIDPIPATGGSITLTDPEEIRRAIESANLRALLVDAVFGTSSTLMLNTGSADIPQADALNYLDQAGLPSSGNWRVLRQDDSGQVELGIAGETRGDLLARGVNAWRRVAAGTAGQFLMTNGISGLPSWETVATERVEAFQALGFYTERTGVCVWYNDSSQAVTISQIRLHQLVAGGGGTTLIDLLLNAGAGYTSIYAVNPGNRPSITAAAGDDASVIATLPDTVAIPAGARLRLDIITAQSGRPRDVTAFVRYS